MQNCKHCDVQPIYRYETYQYETPPAGFDGVRILECPTCGAEALGGYTDEQAQANWEHFMTKTERVENLVNGPLPDYNPSRNPESPLVN